jgi:hypothetical protein
MTGRGRNREIDPPESWEALIQPQAVQGHDAATWLECGVALLQTIEQGDEACKQQQQAALAFIQAIKEGASDIEVKCAQRDSFLRSLRQALELAGIRVAAIGGFEE